MPDAEVETILREIREQVHAAQERNDTQSRHAVAEMSANYSDAGSNGERGLDDREEPLRIDTQLSTIARAWNRLPPVVTNRGGWLARLELWVKAWTKNATRWFTWEQVNFNAAVHHALKDTQVALTILEQRLESLRSDVQAASDSLANSATERQADLERIRTEIHAKTTSQLAQQAREAGTQREVLAEEVKRHTSWIDAQLTEFVQETRERSDRMVDEQRVCFKQLSLEATETALMLDRTRRDLESRLDKIEKRNDK